MLIVLYKKHEKSDIMVLFGRYTDAKQTQMEHKQGGKMNIYDSTIGQNIPVVGRFLRKELGYKVPNSKLRELKSPNAIAAYCEPYSELLQRRIADSLATAADLKPRLSDVQYTAATKEFSA